MKKTLLALSLLVPAMAFAEAPSYSYGEASYLRAEQDNGLNGDGLEFTGSLQFTENFFVEGGFANVEDSGDSIDRLHFGVGGILPVNDSTNVFGTLRVVDWGYDTGTSNDSENGWGVSAGVRSNVTEKIELNGEVGHDSVDNTDTMTYSVGGLWKINDILGLTASFSQIEGDDDFDWTEYRLGARISF